MVSLFASFSVLTLAFFALLTSFFLCYFLMPVFIKKMKQLKKGQPIRTDGPQTHLLKKGTPTMGGVVILFSVLNRLGVILNFSLKRREK